HGIMPHDRARRMVERAVVAPRERLQRGKNAKRRSVSPKGLFEQCKRHVRGSNFAMVGILYTEYIIVAGFQSIGDERRRLMARVGKGRKARAAPSATSRNTEEASAPIGSAPWRMGRPKGTGMQRIYAQVREDIIGLRLPPGADLDEASLEQRFGVSR